MALALLLVTLAAAVAASLSPEANLPMVALVTWFSHHHTLGRSTATILAVSRHVSQTLDR
jgi:hypothetical protein